MAEFSLDFSETLVKAANFVITDGLETIEAKQTVIYLSLLSSEITLKALLEKAGHPYQKIRNRSHDLAKLSDDLLKFCEIHAEIAPSLFHWVPASSFRGIVVVDANYGQATIGNLLECEKKGASKYPNDIRYGDELIHFPAEVMYQMAFKLIEWARLHWDSIRVKSEIAA